MPEWLVRLKGDGFDLEALSARLQSAERNIRKEDNGYYYLRSTSFDSLADDNAVRQLALKLIDRINASANFLLREDFRPVEFDGIMRLADDGKHAQFVYVPPIQQRSRVSLGTTVVKGGEAVESPPPEEFEAMVALAERDDRVADALRFFHKGDWVSLYKVWELVRDGAGGEREIFKNGWTTKKTKDRFTQTAQSRKALGDEARHASEKYKPPTNPMSISEARAFVRALMEIWTSTL